MENALFSPAGKPLSRLIFGAANAELQANRNMDDLLDAILAAGINGFDTARVYGESECALGRWMKKRQNRDQIFLITKGCHHDSLRRRVTPQDLKSDLAESLARLQTDCIDLYLLHRDDPSLPVDSIVDTLNEMKAAGKIRAFGGSNWSHQRIAEANAYAAAHQLTPFAASSPFFSLAEQYGDPWKDGVTIAGPENAAARAWYRENQMPVLSYSGLAHGFLSGKFTSDTPLDRFPPEHQSQDNLARLRRAEQLAREKGVPVSQIALAWLLHQPLNVYPIIGISRREHLEKNLGAAEVTLTDAQCRFLLEGE